MVAPEFTAELRHRKPSEEMWQLGDTTFRVPTWPHPRITVARSSTPIPLDFWPEDVATLLAAAAEAEERVRRAVEAQLPQLVAGSVLWWDSVDDRIAEWRALLDQWSEIDEVYDGVFERGSAFDELKNLRRAVDALDAALTVSSIKVEVEDVPTVVAGEVAGIDPRMCAASDLVHARLGAARAQVIEGLRKKRDNEKRRQEVAVAKAWAVASGSERLRLAVTTGALEQSMGLYRDERLAFEWPEWMWVTQGDSKALTSKALNPSEEALSVLLEAQGRSPAAFLAFHAEVGVQVLVAYFMQRKIWRPALRAWDGTAFAEGSRVRSVASVLGPLDEEPF